MNSPDLRHSKESESFLNSAHLLGFSVTEEQMAQFQAFYHLLLEKNKVMNLTRITDWEGFLMRHVLESLLYSPFIPQNASVLDVGSGGGFPLIPLVIFRPDLKFTAIEVLQKKARYLEETLASLGYSAPKILAERAETLGHKPHLRGHFEVVTSRAVAPLAVLAEYCLPFVKREGLMLALKGPKWEEEIRQAENALERLGGEFIDVYLPEGLPALEARCYMLQILKAFATPKAYPRQAGTPSRQPL